MNNFADGIFKACISAKEPWHKVSILSNKELEILIDGLSAITTPNEFHARIFALAMMAAYDRFKTQNREAI